MALLLEWIFAFLTASVLFLLFKMYLTPEYSVCSHHYVNETTNCPALFPTPANPWPVALPETEMEDEEEWLETECPLCPECPLCLQCPLYTNLVEFLDSMYSSVTSYDWAMLSDQANKLILKYLKAREQVFARVSARLKGSFCSSDSLYLSPYALCDASAWSSDLYERPVGLD